MPPGGAGFEKAAGVIEGGDALHVFEAGGARARIAVCHDARFPLPVRALENRIFVAQPVTAGQAPWRPALDLNTGEAAVCTPMDAGWPDDGVLARRRGDEAWTCAELDLAALDAGRAQAQVPNDRDRPGRLAPGSARARLVP